MSLALRAACLLSLSAVVPAWGQAAAAQPDSKPAPAKWTVLFRSSNPAYWDRNVKTTKGEQVAIPVKYAPATMRYLRLRRLDTGEALILPLSYEELRNGKPRDTSASAWWNGTAKKDWKGRHLGIVQGPRHKFPAPHGLIGVMTEGWDLFAGSGFGHKCGVNDGQYYCWRGKEIPRTLFEIAVSDGPLTREERRCLVSTRKKEDD